MSDISQSITTYSGTIPDKASQTPAAFSAAADTFVDFIEGLPAELNTFGEQANTLRDDCNSAKTGAESAQAAAETAQENSEHYKEISLANANFKGAWSMLTGSVAVPASVLHNGSYWMLLSDLVDVTAKEPGVDLEWSLISIIYETDATPAELNELVGGGPTILHSHLSLSLAVDVTSTRTITTADKTKIIDVGSGTFTLTFDSVVDLADGFWCYVRNNGTGDITLETNASETIDGLTTFIMYPGEVRLFQCDGSVIRSIVMCSFYKVFTASGTFTKPPGYPRFAGLIWSGGASGKKSHTSSPAPGGAGGGCGNFDIPASLLGASEDIAIGAGGASATTDDTYGNVGGNTSLGAIVYAYGGSSYIYGGSVLEGRVATTPDGYGGGNGTAGFWGGGGSSDSLDSGVSWYGGGAGGGLTTSAVLANGTSTFGGDGGAASLAGNGSDGEAPGGGGGATQTGTQSGAGARGELRIWGCI